VKSASTVAQTTRPRPVRTIDGWIVALLGAGVAVLLATAARQSPTAFIGIAAAGVAIVGYAATRWPLPMLVAAALLTVVDLELTPRLLPEVFADSPIGLSEPVLAVAGIGIAIGALRRGTFWNAFRDPVLPLIGVFVGLAVASAIVNATPPVVAALGLLMTLDAVAIYFTVRMVPIDERAGAVAIAAIVLAVVAAALFGIAQAILDPDLLGFPADRGNHGEGIRITSVFGSPNMLAAVVGLSIPFALFAGRHLPDARGRWIARVVLFILVCALLLTFSRGAWLAVALGGLIGALLVDWRALPLLLLTVALAWGAVTVMPQGILVPGQVAADRDGGGGGTGAGNGGGNAGAGGGRRDDGDGGPGGGGSNRADDGDRNIIDSTIERLRDLSTRARYLRAGIPIILDHPLLGVGPGRYGGAAATIIPSPVYDEYDTRLFGYRTVHSFWLHLMGEAGALGTAAFLAILLGLLIRFVRAARSATRLRLIIVGGAAMMLIVGGFHSFTEMIFEGNMPVLVVWLVLGIASLMAPSLPLVRPRASPEAARAG
jgi:hypothetical protein